MISPEEILKKRVEDTKPILEAIKLILEQDWDNDQEFIIYLSSIRNAIPYVLDKNFQKKSEEYSLRKIKSEPTFDQEEFDSLSPFDKKIYSQLLASEFFEKFYEENIYGKPYDCSGTRLDPRVSEIIKKEFEKYGWNVSFKINREYNEMYLIFTTHC